jgi:hypothetical protein
MACPTPVMIVLLMVDSLAYMPCSAHEHGHERGLKETGAFGGMCAMAFQNIAKAVTQAAAAPVLAGGPLRLSHLRRHQS